MTELKNLSEIYISFNGIYTDETTDDVLDRIEKSIDRDDIHAVMFPFESGVSIFFENIDGCELSFDEYKEYINTELIQEFGDELNELEFVIKEN